MSEVLLRVGICLFSPRLPFHSQIHKLLLPFLRVSAKVNLRQAPMNPATSAPHTHTHNSYLQSSFTNTTHCKSAILLFACTFTNLSRFDSQSTTLDTFQSALSAQHVIHLQLYLVQYGEQPALPLGRQSSSAAPLRFLRATPLPPRRESKLLRCA